MSEKKILIVAGEASGDLHASNLIKELKKINPNPEIFGIGGDRMRQAGVELIFHIDRLSFMGFAEVIKNLKLVRKVFKTMKDVLDNRRPDLVILVDYPGFNLKFAQRVKEKGIRVAYYISPQIWAWGGKRLDKIKKLVDKMIVIFPFEKDIYKNAGVDVEFVGHPLLEVVRPHLTEEEFKRRFDIKEKEILIGLLPGSRWQEVSKILPIMLDSVLILKSSIRNLKVALGLAPTIEKEKIQALLNQTKVEVTIIEGLTYDLMKYSHLLLVTSGTATLESAILGTPLIVLYKTSFLTYSLARSLVKIPHIALVNVVAGKKIVPEFVQYHAKPQLIALEANEILENRERYEIVKEELNKVKEKLGEPQASKKAAEIINEMLQ